MNIDNKNKEEENLNKSAKLSNISFIQKQFKNI